jgi:hypothetical protein
MNYHCELLSVFHLILLIDLTNYAHYCTPKRPATTPQMKNSGHPVNEQPAKPFPVKKPALISKIANKKQKVTIQEEKVRAKNNLTATCQQKQLLAS